MQGAWYALGLTLLAGLATGIGSIVAFSAKRHSHRFLSITTGFSAGVMLYVSFVEIFPRGAEALTARYGDHWGHWVNMAAFFGGIFLICLIDNLIPEEENPHEIHPDKELFLLQNPSPPTDQSRPSAGKNSSDPLPGTHDHSAANRSLMRMGMFTALAIAIHNFPEGLAVFVSSLQDPSLGVAIALAIALHNIPEGIAVSVPIFFASGNRRKAFVYSLLSGLSEPLGAGVAFLGLYMFASSEAGVLPLEIMGILFSAVAGIMVYISLDELLPTSKAYGKGHDSILGLVAGMFVMGVSLLLMQAQ
ncbi:MAG: zinc transporter ZupT [Thermodesulfobacteriota bacterium]